MQLMPVVTARPICSLNRVKNLQDGVTAARASYCTNWAGQNHRGSQESIDRSAAQAASCLWGAQTTPRVHDMRHLHKRRLDGLSVLDAQTGHLADPAGTVHRARITGADGHARVYYVCAKWMGAVRHTAVGFPAHTPATAHIVL